jgi:hypothetical protein
MDRAELEQLDRDTLIASAKEAGVARPSILTRPELVDELLVRSTARPDDPTLRRVRGFFGLARDLLARVIERGLHLPDAAERVRSIRPPPSPAPSRTLSTALPTVTLAEIYAAQGHRTRAIDTLQHVLEREPEHTAARALLAQLEDAAYPLPSPALPPEDEDSSGPATSSRTPLPTTCDVDECVAIPIEPTTIFTYWAVREGTLDHVRHTRSPANGAFAGGSSLVLRVLVIRPTWDGPQTERRDFDVSASLGDRLVCDLPAGAVVRAAIGWRDAEGFVPIAHSPSLEAPPGGHGPLRSDELVRWTPRGIARVAAEDADASSIQRALGRFGATTGHTTSNG